MDSLIVHDTTVVVVLKIQVNYATFSTDLMTGISLLKKFYAVFVALNCIAVKRLMSSIALI